MLDWDCVMYAASLHDKHCILQTFVSPRARRQFKRMLQYAQEAHLTPHKNICTQRDNLLCITFLSWAVNRTVVTSHFFTFLTCRLFFLLFTGTLKALLDPRFIV